MQEWAGHVSSLNIWMTAPELAPYVAFGGIGTGLRGLVQALSRRGHRVTMAIPTAGGSFGTAALRSEIVFDDPGLSPISICVREIVETNGLRVLLFELPGEESGYGTDVSDDPGAARRVGLFARAVVHEIAATQTRERIDVVHAHEWPTAMVPYLVRECGAPLATVFTLHSLAYQGLFPPAALRHFGLGLEHASLDRLELYGRISLLKGGLVAADRITTVSPTYAREIQTPEHGELLDGVLRMRQHVLSGIVNGIDTALWNPATDLALVERFSAHNLSGKQACKRAFGQTQKLDPDKPLIVSLGRLVEQKGIDWLVGAIPALMESQANVVIAGVGEARLERDVSSMAAVFPGRTAYLGHVTEEDARRLLGAADLLVMPSRWEPCGIVQLQAMRYGALPVARRTGGLADTIMDADERPERANGFLFDEPSAQGVVHAVLRAIARLGSHEAAVMQQRGMLAAHGWEGPARLYEGVYRAAIG